MQTEATKAQRISLYIFGLDNLCTWNVLRTFPVQFIHSNSPEPPVWPFKSFANQDHVLLFTLFENFLRTGNIPTRLYIGVMIFISCVMSYMLRTNLSINILAMVEPTYASVTRRVENITASATTIALPPPIYTTTAAPDVGISSVTNEFYSIHSSPPHLLSIIPAVRRAVRVVREPGERAAGRLLLGVSLLHVDRWLLGRQVRGGHCDFVHHDPHLHHHRLCSVGRTRALCLHLHSALLDRSLWGKTEVF